MNRKWLAFPVVLLVVAACGASTTSPGGSGQTGPSGTGPGTSTSGTDPTDGATAPDAGSDVVTDAPTGVSTAGCGKTGVPTGLSSKTTTVAGASRRYQLFVPTSYDASKKTRLAFIFHGLGGNGDQIRAYLSLESQAAGEALFVYPDGLPQADQGGSTAWSLGDIAFFDTMVSEISSSHCVDPARIFAAGHSFGAYMSNLVGCERGDVVRAIAPVSGGLVSATCKGPVAAWLAHGDSDPVVAQSEGIAARDHWITANGCAKTSKPTTPSPCVTYDGCGAGHPVTWCSFAGGHYPLPAYTQQAIWDFFKVL